jgi:hypothetical protein
LPVFKKGVEFYLTQLNFNFIGILQELDADIAKTKEYKTGYSKLKEAKLKELLTAFDFQNALKFELVFSIEDNIKTMRYLPLFGITGKPVNFRYPTDADIRAMPKDKPIEAVKLCWKPSTNFSYIGGLQVTYSNGVASPVFLAKD